MTNGVDSSTIEATGLLVYRDEEQLCLPHVPSPSPTRLRSIAPPTLCVDQVLQCKSAKGLKANAHDPFNYNQQVGTCSIKSPTIQLVIWVVVLTVVSALVGLVVWYFKLEEKLPKTAMPMP